MSTRQPTSPAKVKAAQEREDRAAAALRENLKRRKKQQQAWAGISKAVSNKEEKD